jgi:uncharacterized protein (DUF111 family)
VDRLERLIFASTTTLGVRRTMVERHALPREHRTVEVLGHRVRIKVSTLPDGSRREKPEHDDLRAVAAATGLPLAEVAALAQSLPERDDGAAGRTTARAPAQAHATNPGEGS